MISGITSRPSRSNKMTRLTSETLSIEPDRGASATPSRPFRERFGRLRSTGTGRSFISAGTSVSIGRRKAGTCLSRAAKGSCRSAVLGWSAVTTKRRKPAATGTSSGASESIEGRARARFARLERDGTGFFWAFWTRRPTQEEAAALEQGTAILSRTDAGRKVLQELGIAFPATLERLERSGIAVRVSRLEMKRVWATTRPLLAEYRDAKPRRTLIAITPRLLETSPVLVAPILIHELVHSSDRRKGIITPSERRGFLLQMHLLIELEEKGLLPRSDSLNGP